MRFSDLKFTKNKISHWGSIGVGLNWGRGSIGPGAQLGRGSIGLGLNWGGAQLGWGSIGVGLNWAGAQLGQGLNWAWGSTEPEPLNCVYFSKKKVKITTFQARFG